MNAKTFAFLCIGAAALLQKAAHALLVGTVPKLGLQLLKIDLQGAREYFKYQQVTCIQNDWPELLQEYTAANRWCMQHSHDSEAFACAVHDVWANHLSHVVLYRETASHPSIVSLTAILTSPVVLTRASSPTTPALQIADVVHCIEIIARQDCKFVQKHELKTWAGGVLQRRLVLDRLYHT